MAEHIRINPSCPNASNPYHVCAEYCLGKIAESPRTPRNKKSLDSYGGTKHSEPKKIAGERKVLPSCVNSSNPYHECGEYCVRRSADTNTHAVKKESGSLSFGRRKKKGSESLTDSSHSNKNAQSQLLTQKRTEERNTDYSFSSHSSSEEISSRGSSFNKGPHQSSQIVPMSINMKNDIPNEPSKNGKKIIANGALTNQVENKKLPASASEEVSSGGSFEFDKGPQQSSQLAPTSVHVKSDNPKELSGNMQSALANGTLTDQEESKKLQALPKLYSYLNIPHEDLEHSEVPTREANSNSHSVAVNGIPEGELKSNTSSVAVNATRGSNRKEADSIISDAESRALLQKYNVKSSASDTLEAIFKKHGDIAVNCQLESTALRAYYLECVCFVIQDLQSTPFKFLTKSKVKEMLAILKDVESAEIDVSWLRSVLNEVTEALESVGQLRVAEVTTAHCDQDIEKIKKELESQMEEFDRKEKEVAIMKEKVAETRAKINELELKFSQAKDSMLSLKSKVEQINSDALLAKIL